VVGTTPAYTPSRPCPSCSREWGAGIACQFCDQVEGLPVGVHLSSPARRFGGYLLEGLLAVVTLGIGWLVWSFVVFGRGQTPAKQILNVRTVTLRTGRHSSWGRMFVREFIAKPLVGLLSFLTLGIANFWLVWDSRNQELWDKVVGTVVVNDPQKLLLERRATSADNAASRPPRELNRVPFPAPSTEAPKLEPAPAPPAEREELSPSAVERERDD
jgi:uncharacterized RDD family membrane protein YckC